MDLIKFISKLISNPNDLVLLSSSTIFTLLAITRLVINRRHTYVSNELVNKRGLRHKLVINVDKVSSIRLGNLKDYLVRGKEFKVELSTLLVPKEFSGLWNCVELGCGGWGCAYKCWRGDEVVVFKVPRGYEGVIRSGESVTISERLMRDVVREAEIITKLSHPNILKLISYSRTAPILIYEYANYGSLNWQLSTGWRPSIKDVVIILTQLSSAIRYIHSRGLIHGDIKPANVFIVNGITKLGDFSSITKLISETTTYKFTYTPGWRAPEQVYSDLRARACREGLENRIDIYQLGNLILYLLTGEVLDGELAVNPSKRREVIKLISNTELRELTNEMLEVDVVNRPSADEVFKEACKLLSKYMFS